MNFKIKSEEKVSQEFLKNSIFDFTNACNFIASLPYKRNNDKNNLLGVFDEKAGTCSTKHATLRKLAIENNRSEVKLILGIFKMDAEYNSKIEKTLKKYELVYIPEAHNYLKINNEYFDFTLPNSKYDHLKSKLLEEKEIEFDQINSEKIFLHKRFLENWIDKNSTYNLDEIWKIREECIKDLQN